MVTKLREAVGHCNISECTRLLYDLRTVQLDQDDVLIRRLTVMARNLGDRIPRKATWYRDVVEILLTSIPEERRTEEEREELSELVLENAPTEYESTGGKRRIVSNDSRNIAMNVLISQVKRCRLEGVAASLQSEKELWKDTRYQEAIDMARNGGSRRGEYRPILCLLLSMIPLKSRTAEQTLEIERLQEQIVNSIPREMSGEPRSDDELTYGKWRTEFEADKRRQGMEVGRDAGNKRGKDVHSPDDKYQGIVQHIELVQVELAFCEDEGEKTRLRKVLDDLNEEAARFYAGLDERMQNLNLRGGKVTFGGSEVVPPLVLPPHSDSLRPPSHTLLPPPASALPLRPPSYSPLLPQSSQEQMERPPAPLSSIPLVERVDERKRTPTPTPHDSLPAWYPRSQSRDMGPHPEAVRKYQQIMEQLEIAQNAVASLSCKQNVTLMENKQLVEWRKMVMELSDDAAAFLAGMD